jgi:aminoglycoside phosphotransferase (APT) family kinase protein
MADAGDTRSRLASYLGAGIDNLRILASGWETTVFEFAIAGRSSRAPDLPVASPLVLRFYEGTRAEEKGRNESRAMQTLAELGFAVPRPYLYEAEPGVLGAPFMIMDRVAGGPLFITTSFPRAFKTFALGFIGFVRAQVRLHRLNAAQSPAESLPQAFGAGDKTAPLLERMLGIVAARIEQGPLPGLRDALEHLRRDATRFATGPAVFVHMDYHPQNVIVAALRVNGVIDWVNADCGDRHLDAGTTAAILSTSTMEHPWWMRENLAGNTLRGLFASLYIPLYNALAPMEWKRFRYCQAVAAVYRLSTFGMMRARGAQSVGYRPEAIAYITPAVVGLLSRYASRKVGVPVSIPAANHQ